MATTSTSMDITKIKTLGELKKAGYQPKTIKEELRTNLIHKLKNKEKVFEGIIGYDNTVLPDIERAILSRHNMVLLGLRGQAKTRIARIMLHLLDEYIPIVEGSELNDDPFNPISKYARDLINVKEETTPIAWMHKSERFAEKLATPDVSVADLIGDVDPIKAVNEKLTYADERVIHFGLIPRSNRCIFVINELPDLQARIQVSLFNILQEGDIQIRGFKLRIPLDIQFVFTANPEDYTNRGSIVTPLKDRIESQILTHYPKDIQVSGEITRQEAHVADEQKEGIQINQLAKDLIEQIAVEARKSEYVDPKSGVSARLTISAYENLFSTAERRALINGEKETQIRVSDFEGVIPAITGKIELVYEGDLEGPYNVSQSLIEKAIRSQFMEYFPDPIQSSKSKKPNPYRKIINWFASGNTLDILRDMSDKEYRQTLNSVDGLKQFVQDNYGDAKGMDLNFLMEYVLHGLAAHSQLNKKKLEKGQQFKDILDSMISFGPGSN